MKILSEIGLPLDGSHVALRGLGCAVWLATRLKGRVHVLHIGSPLSATDPLAELGVADRYRSIVDFHQVSGNPAAEILAAEKRLGIDLIVMSARGISTERAKGDPLKIIGHVAREVVEKSEAPVMLLPLTYEEALPWRSVLVPISGEPGTDDALAIALHLAELLDLTVTVAHVASTAQQVRAAVPAHAADEVHHEYPHLLNEFVARSCAMSTAEERERIDDFCLCHGDVAHELLELIQKKRTSLLVAGWHGNFVAGHAHVVKTLLQETNCPLLLVKASPRQRFRLKVGEDS